MNAAHGHPRGHATCSYELVSCPSSPPASHRRRERGPKSEQERLRRFARGLAPYLLCSKKRRCQVPWPWRRCAGPPAAWRQGGAPWPRGPCSWRTRAESPTSSSLEVGCLIAYLNCPSPVSSPPHHRVPLTASSVERSVPSRASRCWREKRTSAVWLVRRQGLRA